MRSRATSQAVPLRSTFILLIVSIFCAPFADGRAKTAWSIISAGEIDGRIQRQLRELASHNNACLRLSRPARKSASQRDATHLEIALDERSDNDAFLEEMRRQVLSAPVQPKSEPTLELAREGYLLHAFYKPNSALDQIRIDAISATGIHNALLRIPDLLVTPRSNLSSRLVPQPQFVHQQNDGEVTIADYPSFQIRGVVEGFYGDPWSFAARADVLRFEGQHGMNVYYYGPKDDPYHRKLWREPYPSEELKKLGQLADVAKDQFVDFSFAISPGLSMVYSSEAEFQTLTRKIESVRQLGVSNFALFLDDVPQDLVHPEDMARFKTLAQAHISLINRLDDYLKSKAPENRLMVCPTVYTNEWGNRDYIKELGAGVHRGISLDWTGTEVISQEITVAQAQEWSGDLQRHPLVWDNFSTNDGRPWLLPLDPFRKREAGLSSAIEGLFFNPMCQAHASLIPLQTVADYLWNSATYDPEKSERHAIVSQYGEKGLQLLQPLLDTFRTQSGWERRFRALFSETTTPLDIAAVESEISSLHSTIANLEAEPRLKQFKMEIAPLPELFRARLKLLLSDPAFRHLPDGKVGLDPEHDALFASRLTSKPVLDGNFSKWQSGNVYSLNRAAQLEDGKELWKGPSQFSARLALHWDADNLYLGVDIVDSEPYQISRGRGVPKGDAFRVVLNTASLHDTTPAGAASAYDLFLSPGNFSEVKPSVYCEEDFFPRRARVHNYDQEIQSVWRKTADGFSADIVFPAAFMERDKFVLGQEIALSFGAQKIFQLAGLADDLPQISFTSKEDRVFPVESQNPATFQRMVLVDTSGQ